MTTLSYSLYETDTTKYVGPHSWQITKPARLLRRLLRRRAYTRWIEQAFTDIRLQGKEHLQDLPGPCVFVGNHQSHLDTLLVHAALPEHIRRTLYFGAAQDRWYLRGQKKLELMPWYQSLALGNFPIMRGGGRGALSHAQWLLGKGQSVFLFPEGTRAENGQLGEFKPGAVLLALQARVPVVPLYLEGLSEIRPKGSRRVVPGVGTLNVLEPLNVDDMTVAAATTELRFRMNEVHSQRTGFAISG